MTKLEENIGGARMLPSHLRSPLFSQKVRSVSKSHNGFYTVDLGAVKILVVGVYKKTTPKQQKHQMMYSFFDLKGIKRWKMDLSSEMYLNTIVAARLHDQAATSKKSTEGEILFSVGLQFYGLRLQQWISPSFKAMKWEN